MSAVNTFHLLLLLLYAAVFLDDVELAVVEVLNYQSAHFAGCS